MRAFSLIIFACLAFYLAISCLSWGSRNYQPNDYFLNTAPPKIIATTDTTNWLLIDVFSAKFGQLKIEAQEQSHILSYMTWQGERNKILHKQLETLQELVQLSPWSAESWLRLLSIQSELEAPSDEMEFSLAHALHAAEWHYKSAPNIIHYCFRLDSRLSAYVRSMCDDVMRAYPWHLDVSHQARSMRVNAEQLAKRLAELSEPQRPMNNARSN